jgi:hypothetical protein
MRKRRASPAICDSQVVSCYWVSCHQLRMRYAEGGVWCNRIPGELLGARMVATKAKKSSKVGKKRAGTTAVRGSPRPRKAASPASSTSAKPKLLSGDNPQIAKGFGEAPVRAYIAAIPGWKQALAQQLDQLIARTVPRVQKAVKWNSPFYGLDGESWFLSFHCFTKYIKVTFFKGTALRPVPPGESKHKDVRYLDIREGQLDAAQFIDWVKQASKLPGERM